VGAADCPLAVAMFVRMLPMVDTERKQCSSHNEGNRNPGSVASIIQFTQITGTPAIYYAYVGLVEVTNR